MKNQTTVSVVIPFYSDHSGLLEVAVESALNQTLINLEVIVVDDCSPLSAKDELENITDSRLKIIRHAVNSNGGIARNTGIDNAEGKFIAFLDYDDIWHVDKLERQLNSFTEVSKARSKVVIYSQCKIIEGEISRVAPSRAIEVDESVGDYLFSAQQIIQTSGIFLLASSAKEARFHDLRRHQDYQFCLSLEKLGYIFHMLSSASYDFVQMPKKNNYEFSKYWLGEYEAYLTDTAILSFNKLVLCRALLSHRCYITAFVESRDKGYLRYFAKALIIYIVKNHIPLLALYLKKRRLKN